MGNRTPSILREIAVFAALMLAFPHFIRAGDGPDWSRHDSVKAAAAADLIVIARIRDVSILSGKTGHSLKKLPGYVDERYQGQRLRLILEDPHVLWPVGGSIENGLTISWDGITTSYVTAYKNSIIILLLAKIPRLKATEATIYTPPGYWPLADAKDLEKIQSAISARTATLKSE